MAITDIHLKPPPPRTYGHDVEVDDFVKTRSGREGRVVKFENGQVTFNETWNHKEWEPRLYVAPLEEVLVEMSWWLHKIRVWMKAVDATYDDFVSDYIARNDFQRMKSAQVEARKAARASAKKSRNG